MIFKFLLLFLIFIKFFYIINYTLKILDLSIKSIAI